MSTTFLEQPTLGTRNPEWQRPSADRPQERPAVQHAPPTETSSTLTQIRQKIDQIRAQWTDRQKLHAKYSEITNQSLPQVEEVPTTWQEKLSLAGQVITQIPHIFARQAERAIDTLADKTKRDQFAAKVLEESYAIAAGIGARAVVVAAGSVAIVTAGGVGLSALPIAAVGVMAAGAAREIVKNRDIFWSKDTNKFGGKAHYGREYFKRELGIASFRQTATTKSARELSQTLTALSSGIKNTAIAETFETETHQIRRHNIQHSLAATPELSYKKLSSLLGSRANEHAVPIITGYMKDTLVALHTARTKEERTAARDTMKHLYKSLVIAAQVTGQTVDTNFTTELKTDLKTMAAKVNDQLDANARQAAKRAVVATPVQNLLKFAAGVGIYDAANHAGIVDAIKEAWTDATATPSAIAAERNMSKTILPQVINDAHQTILDEKKVTKVAIQSTAKLPVLEPITLPTTPQVELMSVEIKADSDLFHGLKYAGFDISSDGSAKRFLNQVAPLFIERGQMTQEQLDQMKSLLQGDNADKNAEWLRLTYQNANGDKSFDNIFKVKPETIYIPKEDISARFKINPTILQAEFGPNINQPAQEIPHLAQAVTRPAVQPTTVTLGETIKQPPAAEFEPATITQPITATEQAVAKPTAPTLIPRRVEAVMPAAIRPNAAPVKEVVAINPAIMTLDKLSLTENPAATVVVTTNREDIFKLQGDDYAPTAPVTEWVRSSDPRVSPIDAITYKFNEAINVITMNWHSLFSKHGRQLAEGIRTYTEGGYNNAPRLTEIQINHRLQELANGPDTYLNFDQFGQKVSYELVDTHYQSRYDTLTQGLWIDQYATQPNQLVITYCGWAHADAFKILSTTQDIPANIQDALEIIKANDPNTDIKGAVKIATEWYAQNYSNKDTATVFKDLKAMLPTALKGQVDILNNPNASPEKIQEATIAVSNWLKTKNPEAYDMFKLMFDGMGHVDAKDGWMKKNFFEYYSWRRQVLILTPEQQIEASSR